MIHALTVTSVALAAIGALSVCILALRRLTLGHSERRRIEAEARLTPVALELLAGEAGSLGDLSSRDAKALAAVLSRYARQLRGSEGDQIVAFFEGRNAVSTQLTELRSRRAWRRATTAFTLGDMGSETAVPALVDLLQDSDRAVRGSAARSLGRLQAAEAVEPLVYALAEHRLPRTTAAQALLAIGPAALSGLRSLETAPDVEARALAVELVGLLGDASDGSRVLERLRDSSAEVRAKAARALGRLGAEEAAVELRRALDDRIPFVRAAAAHALAVVGDPAVVPELLRVAREDRHDPAHAAAAAAARLDPGAVTNAAADRAAGPHLREAADLLAARA